MISKSQHISDTKLDVVQSWQILIKLIKTLKGTYVEYNEYAAHILK